MATAGPPTGGSRTADIVHGAAGAILGRLALHDLGPAVADGEALLGQGAVDADGWSWPSADPRPPPTSLRARPRRGRDRLGPSGVVRGDR